VAGTAGAEVDGPVELAEIGADDEVDVVDAGDAVELEADCAMA
jgi:hypothetical protein